MKVPDLIFRLDRRRRFLSGPSIVLHQMSRGDCPASDCADRPLSGRDFASPATSSVNHSRGHLTERAPGSHSKENSQIRPLAMARRRNSWSCSDV